MTTYIRPYMYGSRTYGLLRKALGLATMKHKTRWNGDEQIINWGGTDPTPARVTNVLNPHYAVALAVDKLGALRKLSGDNVSVPEWTTSRAEARQWAADGHVVFGRKLLRAAEGRGIEVYTTPDAVGQCPLYTKYCKNKEEYRIHVFKGEVIDVQQKLKRRDFTGDRNKYIRNHDNGYIFARTNVVAPPSVAAAGLAAVHSLGLDFGAVDIGYRIRDDKPFVFEVNTAPGVEGTTFDIYVQKIGAII